MKEADTVIPTGGKGNLWTLGDPLEITRMTVAEPNLKPGSVSRPALFPTPQCWFIYHTGGPSSRSCPETLWNWLALTRDRVGWKNSAQGTAQNPGRLAAPLSGGKMKLWQSSGYPVFVLLGLSSGCPGLRLWQTGIGLFQFQSCSSRKRSDREA